MFKSEWIYFRPSNSAIYQLIVHAPRESILVVPCYNMVFEINTYEYS